MVIRSAVCITKTGSIIFNGEIYIKSSNFINLIIFDNFEDIYGNCPAHDAKVVLGDFSAKVERQSVNIQD